MARPLSVHYGSFLASKKRIPLALVAEFETPKQAAGILKEAS